MNAIFIFIAIRIAGNIARKYFAATMLENVFIFCFLHSKNQPELAPNSLQKKGGRGKGGKKLWSLQKENSWHVIIISMLTSSLSVINYLVRLDSLYKEHIDAYLRFLIRLHCVLFDYPHGQLYVSLLTNHRLNINFCCTIFNCVPTVSEWCCPCSTVGLSHWPSGPMGMRITAVGRSPRVRRPSPPPDTQKSFQHLVVW